MRSSDTLLDYVFRFVSAQNRVSNKKISAVEALRIYHEVIKGK